MTLPTELHIGVATGDLTPPDPALLKPTGMDRLVPTRGVLDDLRAEAMAIAAGGELAFVVTSDLRYLPPEWAVEIRQTVAERTGCDPLRVLLSSVHNHCSSPIAADDTPEAKAAEDRANRKIIDAMINACVDAAAAMAPAEIAAATTELSEPIGENRRVRLDNGTCVNCWGSGPVIAPGRRPVGPAGPDSTRVDILAARRLGDPAPMAVFTSYATHPHLYQLPYFSGEFPGAAKRAIERRVGGAVSLYANHTGGDLDLHCVHPMPDGEDAQVAWFRRSADLLGERFADAAVPAIPTTGFSRPSRMRCECYQADRVIINVLALGDTAFVSIPGELFHSFGLRMLDAGPFAHTLMMAYNGSSPGYAPPAIGYEQGSYEVMRGPGAVMNIRGITRATANETTGDVIAAKVGEMLQRLHEQGDER